LITSAVEPEKPGRGFFALTVLNELANEEMTFCLPVPLLYQLS